jgi:hypothetical protein
LLVGFFYDLVMCYSAASASTGVSSLAGVSKRFSVALFFSALFSQKSHKSVIFFSSLA